MFLLFQPYLSSTWRCGTKAGLIWKAHLPSLIILCSLHSIFSNLFLSLLHSLDSLTLISFQALFTSFWDAMFLKRQELIYYLWLFTVIFSRLPFLTVSAKFECKEWAKLIEITTTQDIDSRNRRILFVSWDKIGLTILPAL